MDKRIESYLDSVIPEKLSKRRQKLIREELRDHIYPTTSIFIPRSATAKMRASKKRWPIWATTEV